LGSPESVAAIFPMISGFFDLVVFDEASQCDVERALPVMLRGKTTVVAGDDKQLQPFDLYQVKVEDMEEAFLQNEMAMEVESVLDLGKNIYPEYRLLWHYRSREEELIQFSNHAFYDGRLHVIPQAQPDHAFLPSLEYRRVEGKWEKNRNEVEAQAVIDLLIELVQRPDRPSIGVVTFNHPQMELIRDMLEQRLDSLQMAFNPDLRAKLALAMQNGVGENWQGLFIKNIENVQGDERDIIIFSVGYARNAAGKLVANFGLLNQRGGGNRLNVAVTRARRKVYVVCSFDPHELDVGMALHDGPPLLKRYLEYVQAVSNSEKPMHQLGDRRPHAVHGSAAVPTGFAHALAARLRGRGLQVDEGVGGTAFKVDLAVRDAQGGYVLGVECEGAGYFAGRSSKEREVYKRRLLEKNGWKLHRVWARAWFLDPERVVKDILDLVGHPKSIKK
jgi:superfamily I DNA and/or RNA helicase/very-short-patch-repair endonuclease